MEGSMKKSTWDFICIGGGSGGIASARRAAQYGKRCLVVEAGPVGGTCVNVGCVPKKIMWSAAEMHASLGDARGYGFDVEVKGFDWAALKASRDAYVKRLNGIYEGNLERSDVALVRGFAKFAEGRPNTVTVNGEEHSAPHVLIATGGRPVIPALPGAEHGITRCATKVPFFCCPSQRPCVLLSDGFFQLERLPKRAVVVGGGYIGVEIAGILQSLGSQTTLVIRYSSFLRGVADSMMADHLAVAMQQQGTLFACLVMGANSSCQASRSRPTPRA